MKFDVDQVRAQFPCLSRSVGGYPVIYLDGPGGTQTPVRVVEKINDYLYYHNANSHGAYPQSHESDTLYWSAKEKLADFLGCSADEVAFGGSTSTNNFLLSYGLLRDLVAGDEILVTDIDHEGNRSPWRVPGEFGMTVRSAAIDTDTITIDMADLESKLSERTRLVAVNWAANSCGTVTDVKACIALVRRLCPNAITVVDAVHYAPHKFIDVKDIDTDVLVCSAYKFFGPHLGVLYVKKETGERFKSVRVMADDNKDMPWKFETGTPAMELACGAGEAVEFIADIGRASGGDGGSGTGAGAGTDRRSAVRLGMAAIEEYEESLADKLRTELATIDGLRIYGPGEGKPRTSTVSFTVEGINAHDIAVYLGEKGISVWDGDFYAIRTVVEVLGLEPEGGMLRIGLAPYNTAQEIDRTIDVIKAFIKSKRG
jgi:cysteine desulfurase family protein (TIGR01976 family)